MERTELLKPSTLVKTVGYHAESQTLEVELHSGHVYQYYPVTQERAEAFFEPDSSAGRLVNEIKRDDTIVCVAVPDLTATTEVF